MVTAQLYVEGAGPRRAILPKPMLASIRGAALVATHDGGKEGQP